MEKLIYENFSFEIDPVDLLYLAVSGSHSYGTARPDSDLDLRGVYMPSFMDSIRLEGGGMKTKFESKEIAKDIDIEFVPIRRWLQIMLGGNGNYLENLWQPKVYPKPTSMPSAMYYNEKMKLISQLKSLTIEHGLSKKFRRHYIGFAHSQRKDFYEKYKTKCLLYVYRVLMSGIVLYRDEVVEYNLPRLLKLVENEHAQFLLDNYTDEKSIVTDHVKMRLEDDIEKLKNDLNHYADESVLPEAPNFEPFNQWLYDLYQKELMK